MYVSTLVNGIVVGTVSSLKDPENLARVQVTYPYMNNQISNWAKLVTLMAGPDRGMLFRPEVGDEVLIAFELGSPDRPYVLGALWSKVDAPPPMGDDAEKNNCRLIKSRSGHILRFDDKDGAEKIELLDKDNKRTLVIDTAKKRIDVLCDGGDGVFEVQVPQGSIKATAEKKIEVTCSTGDVAITAKGGGKVSVVSEASNVEVSASAGSVKVSAVQVEINADASMNLKAGATMNIEASGILTLKGAVVNIN